MWQLARPLIEQWVLDNLGPQARVRESVLAVVASLESLPRLVTAAEKTVEALRNGGLRPAREAVRYLGQPGNGSGLSLWLPWILVVILSGVLFFR
jgi:ubiquinone biosynthesis protein